MAEFRKITKFINKAVPTKRNSLGKGSSAARMLDTARHELSIYIILYYIYIFQEFTAPFFKIQRFEQIYL